jgi:hypothetical protein
MNDETTNLDQADEDILNPTISDEAIEAAAAIESQNNTRQVGTGNSTAALIPSEVDIPACSRIEQRRREAARQRSEQKRFAIVL